MDIQKSSDIDQHHVQYRSMPSSYSVSALVLIGLLFFACGEKPGRAVILISLDTLRQDHLSCYGYARETTPEIDRFAREEAVLFTEAYAQANYTLPSHMSMMTGFYPETHGMLHPHSRDGLKTVNRLPDSYETLAEKFQNKGFLTSAFTDGGLVSAHYGFDQGFQEYRDKRQQPGPNGFQRFGADLHQWIRDHAKEDFFLFIHTFDTHSPYEVPEPYESRFQEAPPARALPYTSLITAMHLGQHATLELKQYATLQDLVDRYDGCVSFVDSEMGKLFDLLKEEGLFEESTLLITSDHGELFMENGFYIGHGMNTLNAVTRIPLILKLPGSPYAGRREKQVVETVDYLPTLLAAAGLPCPRLVQGQNLIPGLDAGRWQKNHAYGLSPNTGGDRYLIKGGLKFIEGVPSRDPLKPRRPPGSPKPQAPYDHIKGRAISYDFDLDPLGIFELYQRGDRAYDLRETAHEWEAEEKREAALLSPLKEAAARISRDSKNLAKRFMSETETSTQLSAEDRAQLEALGYAGLVEESAELKSPSSEENPGPVVVETLVDRTLLNEADDILWDLLRRTHSQDKTIDQQELQSCIDRAREKIQAFAKAHPQKSAWFEWRLNALDLSWEQLTK